MAVVTDMTKFATIFWQQQRWYFLQCINFEWQIILHLFKIQLWFVLHGNLALFCMWRLCSSITCMLAVCCWQHCALTNVIFPNKDTSYIIVMTLNFMLIGQHSMSFKFTDNITNFNCKSDSFLKVHTIIHKDNCPLCVFRLSMSWPTSWGYMKIY